MGSINSSSPPRVLIIGAGARGGHYSRAIREETNGIIAAVAEPNSFKRNLLGKTYIWGSDQPTEGQEFTGWKEFIAYETDRRLRASRGEDVPEGVDAAFVCTLDDQHKEIIIALAPLNLHLMSEKPLATSMDDCSAIYSSLLHNGAPTALFAIGHVLRYSPHNMLLRKLVVEEKVVGDVLSMEHTEPVGWWHFAHSYVRGNWRNSRTSAPSLLTKSCHDMDFLLWLLCSPAPDSPLPPHLPSTISSTGSLIYFRPGRKPALAGTATNCLSCPVEKSCVYSAKNIYHDGGLIKGDWALTWASTMVVPEIEDCLAKKDREGAKKLLMERLSQDWDASTPKEVVDSRPWYGRCVFESDNDVCDDQIVTITWEDDPLPPSTPPSSLGDSSLGSRAAKRATFHMVAWSDLVCKRRSRVYGTLGEIETDGETIIVRDFKTGKSTTHVPGIGSGHHGGGDGGLAQAFMGAIEAVKSGTCGIEEAQRRYVGCDLEEAVRSHGVVFAAEEARRKGVTLRWRDWWEKNVVGHLR